MVLDFETVWGDEYTLSKMTTEEYVRDPRFHAYGMSWKWYNEGQAQWVPHRDLPAFFSSVDWTKTAALAHNAAFDVAILGWVYRVFPAFIFDSLSMARALHGVEQGNSLAKLAEQFGLPPKGNALHSTKNLGPSLPAHVEHELAVYCNHDVALCEGVFTQLYLNAYGPSRTYPRKELQLIDMTLKMYTNPVLHLNVPLLENAKAEDANRLANALAITGMNEAQLASNPQFCIALQMLGAQVPYKVSKTTGEKTPALAKTDVEFQALVNSDNEDVALLCEARLRVKSTLERTRAQRFIDIAGRGPLPVPLNYYGANTGRWAAAKQGINLQNLKRGSFLRKSIEAPPGHVLVVGDLSQIEPRVLAWYAGYDELLALFASGKDAYAAFGAQMFGIPGLTKETYPLLRQSAKSALLGCFGPDTKVLTPRGWVPIINVSATDTVWDGHEWVQHQGVLAQGEKETVEAWGLSATLDHEILTEHGWVEWREVAASRTLFKSALLSANLPAWIGCGMPTGTTPSWSVPAAGPDVWTGTMCCQEKALAATPAQNVLHSLPGTVTRKLHALTKRIVSACSTAFAQSLGAVHALTTRRGLIMADVVSLCTRLGLQIAPLFCGISSGSMGGTSPRCSLIASTTTAATRPATSDSAHVASTCVTSAPSKCEKSKPSVRRMQTYDIALAGPRNRYTILSASGPIIVHNCGYGLGWANMAAQLLGGFLGAPPQRYDMAFFDSMGLRPQDLGKFMRGTYKKQSNKDVALAIPHTCSDEQMIVHCCVTKAIIDRYRNTAEPVTKLWSTCDLILANTLLGDGESCEFRGLQFERRGDTARIFLPNSMAITYKQLCTNEEGEYVYGNPKTRTLYGSKIVENVVQAVARIVCSDAMLRVQKRYRIVHCAHDELVCVVPEKEAEEAYGWVIQQMVTTPRYLPGIPLAAEGGFDASYGGAK
jgi:hypothetical protein